MKKLILKLLFKLLTFETFTIHAPADGYDFISFKRYSINFIGKNLLLDELNVRCKIDGNKCIVIDGGYRYMSTGMRFKGFRTDVLCLLISDNTGTIYINGINYILEGFKTITV